MTKKQPRRKSLTDSKPVQWREVLGSASDSKTRHSVTSGFRAAGFTPDDVALKAKEPRAALASILTGVEDELEMSRPRCPDRWALQAVRRRLEWEVLS